MAKLPQAAELSAILQKKPLGRGEYGATYSLSQDTVVKVIEVSSKQVNTNVQKEVELHKKAQELSLHKKLRCVVPILSGPRTYVLKKTKYVVYSMPKLQKFVRSKINFQIILTLNAHLVEHGFLHNDLHQGNIMMMNGSPTIIDLGLMRSYKPPSSRDLLRCIAFAQAAALIDNCNTNTVCPTAVIQPLLQDSLDFVVSFFKLSKRDKISNVVAKINAKTTGKVTQEIFLQLLLACLSTNFRFCEKGATPWLETLCEKDSPKVDFIYAIRNPASFGKTLSRVYKAAQEDHFLTP